VRELARTHTILYMTARGVDKRTGKEDRRIFDVTLAWLSRWGFPAGYSRFTAGDKGQEARTLFGDDIAFAVDDGPHHVESFIAAGIPTFMPCAPYNGYMGYRLIDGFCPVMSLIEAIEKALDGGVAYAKKLMEVGA
jgi:hypothetical protein